MVVVPLFLGLLGSAALAAHAPCDDVSEHSQDEGDQEKNADTEGLAAEDGGKSVNAVLLRGTTVDGLEVEEEAWVANTVAVEGRFNVGGEVLETI